MIRLIMMFNPKDFSLIILNLFIANNGGRVKCLAFNKSLRRRFVWAVRAQETFRFLSQAWNVWIAIEHKNIYGYFTVFNAKNFTPSYYFLLRLVMAQARASVWVCDTVYIALLLTFIGGPINPDLETKHNCEERGVFTWEREGERDNEDIYEVSQPQSLTREAPFKVPVGAKLSDRVATQQSEKND